MTEQQLQWKFWWHWWPAKLDDLLSENKNVLQTTKYLPSSFKRI